MDYIDHISLLSIKNKKVLLCVSKNKTKWQLPGGKREVGETDEQALLRECREELGVKLKLDTIKFIETLEGSAHGKPDGVSVRIKIYSADFEGEIIPSAEVEKAEYLMFDQVPDTSEVGWEYLKNLKSSGLIE